MFFMPVCINTPGKNKTLFSWPDKLCLSGLKISSMTAHIQNAHIYRFLSLCFAYPNKGFIKNLEHKLEDIEEHKSELHVLINLFKAENLETLQGEYTRLFITGYPKTPCPPYESVQLEGRIMGKAADAVEKIYKEWGMRVEPGILDHISTELEFCAFLLSASTLEEDTAIDAQEAYDAFKQNHLCVWLPGFLNKIQANADFQVYRQLAALVQQVVC
jgi:TorA maturation chaperone TorD